MRPPRAWVVGLGACQISKASRADHHIVELDDGRQVGLSVGGRGVVPMLFGSCWTANAEK